MVALYDPTRLPVLIDVLGEVLYAIFYGGIHGILHVGEGQDRRAVNGREGLLCLRRLLEEVHGGLEGILRTLGRGVALLIEDFQEDIVLLCHVIRTSAAVLHRGGRADVRGGLLEEGRVEFVISEVAEDCLRGRDIGVIGLALCRATDGNLQMELLNALGTAWSAS